MEHVLITRIRVYYVVILSIPQAICLQYTRTGGKGLGVWGGGGEEEIHAFKVIFVNKGWRLIT